MTTKQRVTDDIDSPVARHASDRLVHEGGGDIARLLEIMRRLRDPEDGCPWDLKQTHASLSPYVIEEAYEVVDAIQGGEPSDLRDELGDLLLQVTLHAQLASEREAFDFAAIVETVSDKLVRRHPHVFAGAAAEDWDWEAIKADERANDGDPEATGPSAIAGVAKALPALSRAEKLQSRAAKVGFDWPRTEEVLDKLQEETAELLEASRQGADPDRLEDELGDMLFVLANLARHLKIDPEAALRRTNDKFVRRFQAVESALAAEGRRAEDATLAEMDAHWDAAKARERGVE